VEAVWYQSGAGHPMDQRWGAMLLLSFAVHLALFSVLLFVPEAVSPRRIRGIVYEVQLVEMPGGKSSLAGAKIPATREKGVAVSKKGEGAKRLPTAEPKTKPAIIAKRTVKSKKEETPAPKTAPSDLIDKAISRIERKVAVEKDDHLKQALSRLESKAGQGAGEGEAAGRGEVGGFVMTWYQMEVENRIKSNWSYPVELSRPEASRELEAVVVLKVENSGRILNSRFTKRSSDAIFDHSVQKAIERSDPLPPFPEGYRRTYDEIEINFNLRDLAY
jgi:colicin import membrane protein